MATRRRSARVAPDEALFARARTAQVPFEFVLQEIEELAPYTKPMFGCTAVYIGERIVFILRDRPSTPRDNGVWIATTREHHASLRAEMTSLRSIGVLGGGDETGWQCVPVDALAFEDDVLRACALVRAGDARIGKVPRSKKPRAPRGANKGGAAKTAKAAKKMKSGARAKRKTTRSR